MKFLVIDDNFETTYMIKQFLEKSNFDVTIANNAKEGLNLILNDIFDSILLDIAMPEFNGIDVVEELNEKKFTDFKKIIIMTALAMTPAEVEFLNSYGIEKIISKPLKMSKLINEIVSQN